VKAAYMRKRLTPAKTVELLHETLAESDLPEPDHMTGSDTSRQDPASHVKHRVRHHCTDPFHASRLLRELQASSGENEAILLANVARELEQGGTHRPTLDPVAEACLKPTDLTEMAELAAFAIYKAELDGEPSGITAKRLSLPGSR